MSYQLTLMYKIYSTTVSNFKTFYMIQILFIYFLIASRKSLCYIVYRYDGRVIFELDDKPLDTKNDSELSQSVKNWFSITIPISPQVED